MNNQQDEYLTIEEVAEKLKVKKVTIYRMARRGQLPAMKFGRVWRINSQKLSELFEKRLKSK